MQLLVRFDWLCLLLSGCVLMPEAGSPGSIGAPGKNGADGRPGFPGASGADGARGPPGKDGQTPSLDEFYGTLKGVVRKASDASYVSGATVDILADKQVIRSMVTPASGMDNLEYTEPVDIFDSRTTKRTFAVAKPVDHGQLRMVLTWGEEVKDLDSHLLTPTGCHVYFGLKQCPDNSASLDADVTDGFGPETISIHTLRPGLYQCEPLAAAVSFCMLTVGQVQGARVQQWRDGGQRC
jgi:hypothetical protein